MSENKYVFQNISEYIPHGIPVKYYEQASDSDDAIGIHQHYLLMLGMGRFLHYSSTAKPASECEICGVKELIEENYQAEIDPKTLDFYAALQQGTHGVEVLGVMESDLVQAAVIFNTEVNKQIEAGEEDSMNPSYDGSTPDDASMFEAQQAV
jgi:hypothetical protein